VDPAGWQRAKPIIEEALQRSAQDRRAFVASACDDEALRREIEALLESYEITSGSRVSGSAFRVDEGSRVDDAFRGDDEPCDVDRADVESGTPNPEPGTRNPEPGTRFEFVPGMEVGGRYVLAEVLGKGGGGEVYRAQDVRLQRDVAIKFLPVRSDVEGARCVREARAVAQLNHRGIATIHDVFDIAGRAAIVMELVPGPTLADRIRKGKLPIAEVVDVGVEVADAVEHAHACGILHCDLKPGNVKFAADRSIKVLDFGLARRSEHSAAAVRGVTGLTAESLEGLALGTPGYMSPEQLLGLPIDFRSDVYSLGVLVYEMTIGQRLFDGVDAMSAAVAVLTAPVVELPREAPRRLRFVVRRALMRRPEDRFPSAAEFRDALAAARPLSWREKIASVFRR
jgi:serine/threonine protein kinase